MIDAEFMRKHFAIVNIVENPRPWPGGRTDPLAQSVPDPLPLIDAIRAAITILKDPIASQHVRNVSAAALGDALADYEEGQA